MRYARARTISSFTSIGYDLERGGSRHPLGPGNSLIFRSVQNRPPCSVPWAVSRTAARAPHHRIASTSLTPRRQARSALCRKHQPCMTCLLTGNACDGSSRAPELPRFGCLCSPETHGELMALAMDLHTKTRSKKGADIHGKDTLWC